MPSDRDEIKRSYLTYGQDYRCGVALKYQVGKVTSNCDEEGKERFTFSHVYKSQSRSSLILYYQLYEDYRATIKPYRISHDVTRDILQPIRGLFYTLMGIVMLFAAPFYSYHRYIKAVNAGVDGTDNPTVLERMKRMYAMAVSCLVKGVVLLLTAPLNYLIRMPLRGLISAGDKIKQLMFGDRQSDEEVHLSELPYYPSGYYPTGNLVSDFNRDSRYIINNLDYANRGKTLIKKTATLPQIQSAPSEPSQGAYSNAYDDNEQRACNSPRR